VNKWLFYVLFLKQSAIIISFADKLKFVCNIRARFKIV